MKSDLSKVKVGDSIWTIQEGWTEVIDNDKFVTYQIRTKKQLYTSDGKYRDTDHHPSAFLTNPFDLEPKLWNVKGSYCGWTEKNGIPLNGKLYVESGWTEWSRVKVPTVTELTLEQIADKFGVDVNTLKIKK